MKSRYFLVLICVFVIVLTLAMAASPSSHASRSSLIQSAPPQSSPTPTEPQYKEGELLVKLSPNLSPTAKQAIHASVGADVLRQFPFIGWQQVRLPQGMNVSQGMTAYKQIAGVVAVEPNYALKLAAVPNDPNFGLQYGLQKIQAPAAWDTTTGSPGVVIAVLDTGVNYNHPDLAANMWQNPGEVPGNNIDDDNNGYVDDVYGIDPSNLDSDPIDDSGHGTTCAGILGAVGNNGIGVTGTNWSVKIMAIKIFFNTSTGFVAEAIAGFDYVTMMRNRGINIRATSNSWRWWFGQFSQSVKDAIDAAGDAGVANVFASGNDFNFEIRCTPAGCRELHAIDLDFQPTFGAAWDSPSILSIASSNENDNFSVFAGYGRKSVDLAAPGENIWTTTIDGNYGLRSGTSMSTPFVAGSIGLLTADDSSLSVASLKATLLNTVDTFPDHVGKSISGGRLNVARALQQQTICTFTVSPASHTFSANAGTGRIDIASGTNCGFAGKTSSNFITITSGAGSGNGSVEFSVTANTTGSQRNGTIIVAGQTVNVTQAAATPESCVQLSPPSASFSAGGGEGSVEIVAGQGCSFQPAASSNDFWISNVSVNQNVVSYTVEPNNGNPRTGTILIADKTFTVTQSSGCKFEFSPEEQSHQAIGGSARVKVYASDARCTWTPESNDEWLRINNVVSGGNFGLSAVGDGLVNLTIDPNLDGVDRTGVIDIGDQSYQVTQGHCSYSFTPGQAFIPTAGSTGSFTLTTTSGCPWTVSSVYDWIHITSTSSGTGSTTVNYMVDKNLTSQYRSGVIYIAQQFGSQAVINPSQFVQIDQDSHLPGKIAFSTNADGDSEIYVMNNDGSNQMRLTDNTAYDDAAAWSPDGMKIAFVSNRDGQLNIYLMDADGSNQMRLTTTNSSDVYPVWSPDGTRIAFQSFRDGNSEIYVMNADGTNQLRLTNNSAGDYFPSWSPNGFQIAFSSNRSGILQVHTMNAADGSNQVALGVSGTSHAPAWSPDGRWIAFMSDPTSSGNFVIATYDTIFQSTQTITTGNDFFPQWSPDSSKIIFTSTRDGNNELYYVRGFNGQFPVRLTNSSANETKPVWQPVPPKIAFTTDRDGNQEIYLMNPDGTNLMNLTNNAATDSSPTWSPDGMKVAFVSNRSGSLSQDIFVVKADGTNPVNLTSSVGSDVSPAWSPDGAKIAFASFRDGNSEIYVMNTDGTNQVRLTNNFSFDSSPTWSPDGTKIAFATNRDGNLQIYTMNADGSNQIRLSNTTANDHVPAWSPDGNKIVFASDRSGTFQVYVMNANGTNQTRLTNTTVGYDFYPQWSSPDGSRIVFSSSRDGNNEIYVMKSDGNSQTNLSANPAFDYGPVWRPQ